MLPLQRGHDGNLDAFWSFRPRQARPCCTCGPRQGDGANRANGRKRKSYRARTVQVHHQGRPGPSAMSFQAGTTNVRHVSLSNSTPIGSVQPRFFRKRVFGGWGVLAIFAYSWVREKSGVNESCPGQVHGHKILVHKMTNSLQSLSRPGAHKQFGLHKNPVPRVFQRLLKNVLCRAWRPFSPGTTIFGDSGGGGTTGISPDLVDSGIQTLEPRTSAP